MMKKLVMGAVVCTLAACVSMVPPPQWSEMTSAKDAQYAPYLAGGKGQLAGQAFLVQQGGGVVKAAGREVTLDPATDVGSEWWSKAGRFWLHRDLVPPSAAFIKARRTTLADAEGRFKFDGLAPGAYYVRTEVTWQIGGYNSTQGGLVGRRVDVADGTREVVLNAFPTQ